MRHEIADGKSETKWQKPGCPKWKPWFAPDAVQAEHEFMQEIYARLIRTNNVNQLAAEWG